jgi:hypothetical protein
MAERHLVREVWARQAARGDGPHRDLRQGARSFNVCAGRVGSAEFDRITHANGAVPGQGRRRQAASCRLQRESRRIRRTANIMGGPVTHGPGIEPLELHGSVETLQVTGGLEAKGGGFDKLW